MRKWFFCLFWLLHINALEKRSGSADYSVSVVIPCHYLHVQYLERVLKSLQQQTVLPVEVVISISEANKAQEQIDELKQLQWSFPVTIITSNERIFPGGNRNIATARTSGKIILYQDADDLPHKQRIEVVKHLFEKYKIHHLIHRFTPPDNPFPVENISLKHITVHELGHANQAFFYFSRVQFGQCAISRKAANKIYWNASLLQGEDLEFCNEIIHELGGSILIDPELVVSGTSGIPGKMQQGIL